MIVGTKGSINSNLSVARSISSPSIYPSHPSAFLSTDGHEPKVRGIFGRMWDALKPDSIVLFWTHGQSVLSVSTNMLNKVVSSRWATTLLAILSLWQFHCAVGFSSAKGSSPSSSLVAPQESRLFAVVSRRQHLQEVAGILATMTVGSPVAHAAMENNQKVFKVGEKLGIEGAKARLLDARDSLKYLVDHYDEIVNAGGGDNVRRYLGTVGTTSGLYGIRAVLKELQEEAPDIVTYTEAVQDFETSLQAADTAVYSANFVEFSAASTKPEKFFADAKKDTLRMQTSLSEIMNELGL